MSKLKRMTAVLLSVIMVVCMFSVPAGASKVIGVLSGTNIKKENATEISSGVEYESWLDKNNDAIMLKIVTGNSGTLKITLYSFLRQTEVSVFDEKHNAVKLSKPVPINGKRQISCNRG